MIFNKFDMYIHYDRMCQLEAVPYTGDKDLSSVEIVEYLFYNNLEVIY